MTLEPTHRDDYMLLTWSSTVQFVFINLHFFFYVQLVMSSCVCVSWRLQCPCLSALENREHVYRHISQLVLSVYLMCWKWDMCSSCTVNQTVHNSTFRLNRIQTLRLKSEQLEWRLWVDYNTWTYWVSQSDRGNTVILLLIEHLVQSECSSDIHFVLWRDWGRVFISW